MKGIFTFILCFAFLLANAQNKLLREDVAGNTYVSEYVSGVFNYYLSNTVPVGYQEAYLQGDVTSKIVAWNRWGGSSYHLSTGISCTVEEIRSEIRYIYEQEGFSQLSELEKATCASWFVLSESERASLYTPSELLELAINFYDVLFDTDLRISTYKRNSINYTSLGYFEKKFYNVFGDVTKVEYYFEYNPVSGVFSDLRVMEELVVLRDTVYGLPYLETKTTTWFVGGIELPEPLVKTRNFSTLNAYEFNKHGASRLIDESALFLLGAIGLVDARVFLDGSVAEMNGYISGSREPLLDKIAAYTFSQSSQLNTYIKNTLNTKLNINYID